MVPISDRFFRAHGLGNDYLVFEARTGGSAGRTDAWPLHAAAVTGICRRGFGEGSDGIVVLMDRSPPPGEPFPLRMFNPDGSEFERSGNGLRVLGAWLAHEGLVGSDPFRVRTGGAEVRMQLHGSTPEGELDLSVEMGRATAGAGAVALARWSGVPPGASGAVPLEHPDLGSIDFVPVWVGNPHAVVFIEDPSVELDGSTLRLVGPFLSGHPGFERGANVQLARVEAGSDRGLGPAHAPGLAATSAAESRSGSGAGAAARSPTASGAADPAGPAPASGAPPPAGHAAGPAAGAPPDGIPGQASPRESFVRIGIWERGVGRTSASGTSSCAATVAAVASGRLDPTVAAGGVRVMMPGGELMVRVGKGLEVELRGPVQQVGTGRLAPGFLARLRRLAETGVAR